MDKQTIINYVLETPTNTNPAILNQMLDEISSGGGSDWKTATVHVTFIPPEASSGPQEVLSFNRAGISIFYTDNDAAIYLSYDNGGNYLPISDLGTVTQLNIPLYKNLSSKIDGLTVVCTYGYTRIDIRNSEVISGDAVIDKDAGTLFISGDCSLKLVLIWDE